MSEPREGLTLEVVTRHGIAVTERGLDEVVLRREEPRFELGSEVAILRRHEPLLIKLPDCVVRFRRGDARVGAWRYVRVFDARAEVLDDRVTILASEATAVELEPEACAPEPA